MANGENRRLIILEKLTHSEKPISASRFAKDFGVSRQIIVGDIALLRAGGQEIIATARGYLLQQEEKGLLAKIAVQHGPDLVAEELLTIVANGGEIIDVIVEHPLYGELQGGLHIKNQQEVTAFLDNCQKNSAALLSQLTAGIHLHTIRYQNPSDLTAIKAALAEKGILYQEK
ncbi:transcriptional regulator of NAD metabolism [Enterococcus sp. PF1-24]|uniref:transcription repressor NadR n=1 Tax=unclassified Enterococcus TaxID=2608891 RepID=UPI00247723A5|nr:MULTISPECIES: transcription repressor NadR [unclassified Enterococcus]MDH6363761.1 transcriptional regulator of NAD metabolism [Enterococcus sp. PFB1-1]MDH6400717.1 transcriptional regulator of NAD metabolism [Enterococcus sp. PF1-24]